MWGLEPGVGRERRGSGSDKLGVQGDAGQATALGELGGFKASLLAKCEAWRAELRGPSEEKVLNGIKALCSGRDG